ncbi:pyridine nucleotide-disulfide oxidoreductase [Marivirga tractuosa]|uniref:Fumarate reductase/succinate dehydrogenase flavoprotein domain protein n=1 Tax=Marivirga tractuosa (strain ATCC 23168 / DSM 4126 / NBRC 15989 / NCIMB 1408 / VKM B-1430 / H-43) TaxID=643867 RepID=E4TRR7_MARTH|nr:YpdA family putative bacillithiol disulfide reductase [Marivirga tractuosa]ADR22766.1 fumarate reductase/succinate dehydrogenase flavoprotein domain protein [Marivirga tractuosa DSM 4126]BDD16563.1 pyridine nucleotide-disulfide oxidoreductase [Marivirga tractuosa]
MQNIDVLIIGAGPIGLACGIKAESEGLSYLIVDKGTLVNSLYHYPYGMTFFSTSDKLEIGGVPFISHNPKPTRMEALEYYRRVASSHNLKTSLYNAVKKVEKNDSGFKVKTDKFDLQAENIIVATGFYDLPHKLGIPGEDLPKVAHYYKEAHPYYDMKLAIVGAANSAVDAALECFRKGAKEVTMVIREEEIRKTVKYWVKPDIENRIKEGSIKAFFQSEITAIREDEIDIKTPKGNITIENDFLLAMTGYEPNYDFLSKMGVKKIAEPPYAPVYDAESMETNVEGIYLAGVICGGMETNKWFIENSRIHADMIMEHIKSKRTLVN